MFILSGTCPFSLFLLLLRLLLSWRDISSLASQWYRWTWTFAKKDSALSFLSWLKNDVKFVFFFVISTRDSKVCWGCHGRPKKKTLFCILRHLIIFIRKLSNWRSSCWSRAGRIRFHFISTALMMSIYASEKMSGSIRRDFDRSTGLTGPSASAS